MRVLIVDDERPARERLRQLLAAHPEVQLVGQAASGAAALALVATLRPEQQPELVLLDIQMPGQTGLDLAASWPEPRPAIVFVTAHEQFALQAFAVAACDYLLKPVAPERLAQSLARVTNLQSQQTAALPMRPTQLLIPDRGRTHVVAVAEISWLEAADNYVVVHTAERAPLLRRSLSALLADLGGGQGGGFVRTHRSAAVALAQVHELQAGDSGDGVVRLRDGSQVPYSRQYRAALLALMQH
jgi:two-component system, LytTR family, response regulator